MEALNKFGRAKGRHCVFVEWIRPVGACKLTVLRLNPGGVVIFQTKKKKKKRKRIRVGELQSPPKVAANVLLGHAWPVRRPN